MLRNPTGEFVREFVREFMGDLTLGDRKPNIQTEHAKTRSKMLRHSIDCDRVAVVNAVVNHSPDRILPTVAGDIGNRWLLF
jgi:hypothetical protein